MVMADMILLSHRFRIIFSFLFNFNLEVVKEVPTVAVATVAVVGKGKQWM